MKVKALFGFSGSHGDVQAGQTLNVQNPEHLAHYARLGLIVPLDAALEFDPNEPGVTRKRLNGETVPPAPAQTLQPADQLTDEQRAAQLRAEQDERLQPFAGGGDWYRFAPLEEGGEPVKVQGREAALEYLTANPGAKPHAAADAPD